MQLKIKYQKDQNYQNVHVTGVWGGMDGRGRIVCEFYKDKIKMPTTATLTIDEKEGTIKESHPQNKREFLREFQVGMSLEPAIALSIGQWLISKAKESLKAIESEEALDDERDNNK